MLPWEFSKTFGAILLGKNLCHSFQEYFIDNTDFFPAVYKHPLLIYFESLNFKFLK